MANTFFAREFFYPEDGDDTFLRNVWVFFLQDPHAPTSQKMAFLTHGRDYRLQNFLSCRFLLICDTLLTDPNTRSSNLFLHTLNVCCSLIVEYQYDPDFNLWNVNWGRVPSSCSIYWTRGYRTSQLSYALHLFILVQNLCWFISLRVQCIIFRIKYSLCLISYELCHNIRGNGGIASPFLTSVLHEGEWWASPFHSFAPRESLWYPLGRRLHGPTVGLEVV
jgi:hypothetical protein